MEESPSCYNKDLFPVAKGKRTKRHRPHSPIDPFTITQAGEYNTTATTTTNDRHSPTVSATSLEESATTEEEDTAKCLLLLANGEFEHNKRYSETGATKCMYACKTCDRVFSSFQALGGHRASHRKIKNEKYNISDNIKVVTNSVHGVKSVPSPRIHVCSYCRAEFTSGQALGGHMRRHRAAPISLPSNPVFVEEPELEPEKSKKQRNDLCLDLNLPAPEKLVFSTTPVDCHY